VGWLGSSHRVGGAGGFLVLAIATDPSHGV
jgi:hypothetical protein